MRILITGANRGLGFATARRLAQDGHDVWIGARDEVKGQSACEAIRAAVPKAMVELVPIDLASLASIRTAAERAIERLEGAPLDVLFHNAGLLVPSPTRRLTADGIEETLAVNTLAPIALTHALRQALGAGSRVVLVSSRLHFPGSRGVPVDYDLDDPEMERAYHPERAYKNSKLAVLWATYELAARLAPRSITVNAVCPGFVPTTAAANTHGFMKFFLRYVLPIMPFATSKGTASRHFAELATSPAFAEATGKFFADGAPMESSPESRDPVRRERFWAWACQRIGIDPSSF